jgi:hypothetical protein
MVQKHSLVIPKKIKRSELLVLLALSILYCMVVEYMLYDLSSIPQIE